MICAGGCGKVRTEGAKYRDDHWRRGLCPGCYDREYRERGGRISTEAVRRYRSDPEKAERDRARARAWKAANRERNRARDRQYQRQRRAAA